MTETDPLTLIVEDDPSTRELIAAALAKRGMASAQARSVGQALVELQDRRTPPSSVVLDLRLPDGNGTILLRHIRRNNLPVRVAVVTGVADPAALFHVVGCAPDRLFAKPVDLVQLVEWIVAADPTPPPAQLCEDRSRA
jgi:two-component system, NtrC family, response regulator PilR